MLTDAPSFSGAPEHLTAARAASGLPALRKDFMLEPYQIAEARALGADCILIIMAAVDDAAADALAAAARSWGMDAIAEVHDEAELDRALRLDCRLIGINNRDLKTFATTLATTERLAPHVPPGRIVIAESGISRPCRPRAPGEAWRARLPRGREPDAPARRGGGDPGIAGRGEGVAMTRRLSHLDDKGEARMVDVSDKAATQRTARAEGFVAMAAARRWR